MNTLHPIIKVKRLNPDAPMPKKAHETDAAYDLCAMEDVTLMPGEWKMVGSGIAMAMPEGWCGKIYPRSGLGCKGLVLKNGTGVIDSHYRGEIMIPLMNGNPTHVAESTEGTNWIFPDAPHPAVRYKENDGEDAIIRIHKGDRVAQLCIELVPDTELVEVEELDETDRNQGGFGSSGTSTITGGERL